MNISFNVLPLISLSWIKTGLHVNCSFHFFFFMSSYLCGLFVSGGVYFGYFLGDLCWFYMLYLSIPKCFAKRDCLKGKIGNFQNALRIKNNVSRALLWICQIILHMCIVVKKRYVQFWRLFKVLFLMLIWIQRSLLQNLFYIVLRLFYDLHSNR